MTVHAQHPDAVPYVAAVLAFGGALALAYWRGYVRGRTHLDRRAYDRGYADGAANRLSTPTLAHVTVPPPRPASRRWHPAVEAR